MLPVPAWTLAVKVMTTLTLFETPVAPCAGL